MTYWPKSLDPAQTEREYLRNLEIQNYRMQLNKIQYPLEDQKMEDTEKKLEGKKNDDGKARWELLPYDALEGIVDILTLGAKKYDSRNWEKGIAYGRVFGAVQRHLKAWWQDHTADKETGKSHLDHALTELLFLSAYEKRRMSHLDDRPKLIVDLKERPDPYPNIDAAKKQMDGIRDLRQG